MISLRRILLMIVIFTCIFTIIGSANDKIKGKLHYSNGDPYSGKIKIERIDSDSPHTWENIQVSSSGDFEQELDSNDENSKKHHYKMTKGSDEDDRIIEPIEWQDDPAGGTDDDYVDWSPPSLSPPPPAGIPEFPTIALPVAAVIGLVFLFNHRKNGEDRI